MNDLLAFIGENTLIIRENLRSKAKKIESLQHINHAVATKVLKLSEDDTHSLKFCPVAENIKVAIDSSNYSEKVRLLTLFGTKYRRSEIENMFQVGRRAIKKANEVLSEGRIFGNYIVNHQGKTLSENTVKAVISFYQSDKASRMLPGKNDWKMVTVNGKKEKRQKKLLMGTVSEIYELFKSDHPDIQISLTKFSMLRPKECIHVNSKGNHNVCVCNAMNVQNMKM